jgi:hypothetical protein
MARRAGGSYSSGGVTDIVMDHDLAAGHQLLHVLRIQQGQRGVFTA